VQEAVEDITKSCGTCAKLSSKPAVLNVQLGLKIFVSTMFWAADLMYLASKYVLHVVDEATHYSAATFLKVTAPRTPGRRYCAVGHALISDHHTICGSAKVLILFQSTSGTVLILMALRN